MSRWGLATKVGYKFLKIKTLLLKPLILKLHNILIKKIGKRGAITLELALSIPIFMGLLYYMHDIPKMNAYKTRIKFEAMCAANMFQNISSKRVNKRITLRDYAYISSAIQFIRVGGGVNHYYSSVSKANAPYLQEQCLLYYIKGLGNNQAKIVWALRHYVAAQPPPARTTVRVLTSGNSTERWYGIQLKINQAYDQTLIHENLNLAVGEVAIMVEINLSPVWTQMGYYDNTRKDFKLLIASPKAPKGAGMWVRFPAFVIFSPKPGLFSETPPSW